MKKKKDAVDAVETGNGVKSGEQRYQAPALDKGLDILELVSRATEPFSAAAISRASGRRSTHSAVRKQGPASYGSGKCSGVALRIGQGNLRTSSGE